MGGPGSLRWKLVGYRLTALRLDRGMSQWLLAERTGLPEGFIAAIEEGREHMSKSIGVLLGAALGVDMEEEVDV